jgi:uncharacterized membrane protein YphA (DoxX/SURF4 family)
MEDPRIRKSYWMLRVAYGAVPVVAGLDKFTNLLVDWKTYLAPWQVALLPVSPATFMHLVGLVEVAVGIAILAGLTRLGAYVASAWLAAIALSILTSGQHLDVAVRDLMMALGAFTLGRLAEVIAPARREVLPARAAPASASPTAQHG